MGLERQEWDTYDTADYEKPHDYLYSLGNLLRVRADLAINSYPF